MTTKESTTKLSEPIARELMREDSLHIPVGVGTMGWSYDDWGGVFYPEATESKDRLKFYAYAFDTVEIDSTFYGTPRSSVIQGWKQAVPANFVFSAKVPSLITHELGLRDCIEPLRDFVHAVAGLGEKRGPMLFQMPPSFTHDEFGALRELLGSLHMLGDSKARFAIEFRHPSLLTKEVFALLTEHNVALAATDYDGLPRQFVVTANFGYIRLIGSHGAFSSHHTMQQDLSTAIGKWAGALVHRQSKMKECWVYCNNDYEGYAPGTARRMLESLGLTARAPAAEMQGRLF